MADVFLSYARATRKRIETLSGAMEASGYRLWWDRALNASDDYALVIEEQLDAAGCVVVAWSQPARQSLWVRAEANEALDAGKLVQINLDGARLPLPFRALQFLDFRSWTGTREGSPWREYDGRVAAMLRGDRAAEMSVFVPEPERGPALQGFGWISLIGWAALLLAAAMAGAVAMVAAGKLSAATYSAGALLGAVLAILLFGLAAIILIRISLASRR